MTSEATAFRSTRAVHPDNPVTFREALLNGIAPDGGLYIPVDCPRIDPSSVAPSRNVADVAGTVLPEWVGDDVPADQLSEILSDALNFPAPLVRLEDGAYRGISVLELFHGPTLSFKDFGARMMARLMSWFLRDTDGRLTILVATSGDTGSAVADGFAGQSGINVVLLYPRGMVSEVQERQLIVQRPGVRALAVDGTFDDCQRLVKEAFADQELKSRGLSSANSINIGRLLPQMTYYWWAGVQREMQPAIYCVPSGNLGNLTAGMMAMRSGLPAAGFIAAHNTNNFFPRFLDGEEPAFGETHRTISNAMDVGAPSNFERLRAMFRDEALRQTVRGTSVDDAVTRRRMKHLLDETGYLADPHTAVGIEAALRYRKQMGNRGEVVVLATAHPAKFPETVSEATGVRPRADALDALMDAEVQVSRVEPNLESFRRSLLQA